MVSGRAHRHESVGDLSGHDLVDGLHGRAGAPERGLVGAGRHDGILVDPHQALAGAMSRMPRHKPADGPGRYVSISAIGGLLAHETCANVPARAPVRSHGYGPAVRDAREAFCDRARQGGLGRALSWSPDQLQEQASFATGRAAVHVVAVQQSRFRILWQSCSESDALSRVCIAGGGKQSAAVEQCRNRALFHAFSDVVRDVGCRRAVGGLPLRERARSPDLGA